MLLLPAYADAQSCLCLVRVVAAVLYVITLEYAASAVCIAAKYLLPITTVVLLVAVDPGSRYFRA